MPRRHEPDIDLAQPQRLAISDRHSRLGSVARVHDRQRLGRGPNRAVPAACVIGMAVRYERARHRTRGINPHIRRGNIDPFGSRLDPVAQCHRRNMGDGAALSNRALALSRAIVQPQIAAWTLSPLAMIVEIATRSSAGR